MTSTDNTATADRVQASPVDNPASCDTTVLDEMQAFPVKKVDENVVGH